MEGNEISTCLRRIGLMMLVSAAATSAAAQTQPGLETALPAGTTAWITDTTGRELKTEIVGLADGVVTARVGEASWQVATADIRRVRVRRSDSVLNGAVIGAGAAVASGLLLCTLTEPWENCRDDVGPMVRIGALGAGIGIGIDALIRGRRTIYETANGTTRLHVAPIVGVRTTGVQVAVRF